MSEKRKREVAIADELIEDLLKDDERTIVIVKQMSPSLRDLIFFSEWLRRREEEIAEEVIRRIKEANEESKEFKKMMMERVSKVFDKMSNLFDIFALIARSILIQINPSLAKTMKMFENIEIEVE